MRRGRRRRAVAMHGHLPSRWPCPRFSQRRRSSGSGRTPSAWRTTGRHVPAWAGICSLDTTASYSIKTVTALDRCNRFFDAFAPATIGAVPLHGTLAVSTLHGSQGKVAFPCEAPVHAESSAS